MKNIVQENEKPISGAIKINEKEIRTHLDGLVRQSVEDARVGSYKHKLLTKTNEVELRVPRFRPFPFETQIIERYKMKQSSVEKALIEMYLAGVSVRRVEDITEALWGAKVSSSTVSE